MSQNIPILSRSQMQPLLDQPGVLYFDERSQSVQTRKLSLFRSPSPEQQTQALRIVQESMRAHFGCTPLDNTNAISLSSKDLAVFLRSQGYMPPNKPHPVTFAPAEISTLAGSVHQTAPLNQATAIFLCTASLLSATAYPLDIFAVTPDTFYDITDAILNVAPEIQHRMEGLPKPQRSTALFKLAHAVDIADYAKTLQSDNWTPGFAQTLCLERMKLREAGISAQLAEIPPMRDWVPNTSTPLSLALRGAGSVTDSFLRHVDNNGGCARILAFLGMAQKLSSLNPICRAYTYMLLRGRADIQTHIDELDPRLKKYGPSIQECFDVFSTMTPVDWNAIPIDCVKPTLPGYESLVASYAGKPQHPCFEKTLFMWLAMQHEMFANLSLPGSDHHNRFLHLFRTESPDRLLEDTQLYHRCPVESGSFGMIVQSSNRSTHLTEQDVPFHRIMGSCLLGGGVQGNHTGVLPREPQYTSKVSILTTDSMCEVMFFTPEIPYTRPMFPSD